MTTAAAIAAGLAATTAAAQTAPLESRVGRLESEMRAVQRKVFPGGAGMTVEPQIAPQQAPADVPGAPSSSAVADLTQRVSALEASVRSVTGEVEQAGYRIRQLEQAFEAYRKATDARLTALEGGAPAPATLVDKVAKSIKKGGPQLGYGMTETNAFGPGNTGKFYTDRPTSTGRAIRPMQLAVWDPVTKKPLGPNEYGEIMMFGPMLIRGYWNRPDATAETIENGWLHTGDGGYIDDEGFLYIKDRIKDMILRGGENVFCTEVEGSIYEHPAVYDAMFHLDGGLVFAEEETPEPLKDAFAALAETLGEVAGDGTDPALFTELFWSALHGLATLTRAGRIRTADAERRVELLVDRLAVR